MSDKIWNSLVLDVLDIVRHLSLLTYILFVASIIAYVIAYRMPNRHRHRSQILVSCTLSVLLISFIEIEIATITSGVTNPISDQVLIFLFFLFIPPTNLCFAYCLQRNWQAAKLSDNTPIHWAWFLSLVFIHVPLLAILLSI